MLIVKKYGNRRLYDTARSRYITLADLAELVSRGADVEVVDARSGEDLTDATLAQIVVEGRGAARLLPAPLLVRLIRMGDAALAEFFGQYMSWALELYLQARQGAQAIGPAAAFSRMFAGRTAAGRPSASPKASPARGTAATAEDPLRADRDEIASLRRELEGLKRDLRRRRRRPAKGRR